MCGRGSLEAQPRQEEAWTAGSIAKVGGRRMPKRKPTFFSDWREFFREFIIIVLGVLTALIAQSIVRGIRLARKSERRDRRHAPGARRRRRTASLCSVDDEPMLQRSAGGGEKVRRRGDRTASRQLHKGFGSPSAHSTITRGKMPFPRKSRATSPARQIRVSNCLCDGSGAGLCSRQNARREGRPGSIPRAVVLSAKRRNDRSRSDRISRSTMIDWCGRRPSCSAI